MANKKAFEGRNAVVFAATGAIAGATAAELAMQGARLFLTGRAAVRVRVLAAQIELLTGIEVGSSVVNAEDQDEVAFYFQSLAHRGITPDLVFNGIGVDPVAAMYGHHSEEVTLSCFLEPLTRIVGSQFLTATLAAAQMKQRGSGTIVLLTSSLAKSAFPNMAGITATCDAIQGLARVLAAEYGPSGLRVVCVRVDAIPETRTIQLSMAANARTLGISAEEFAATIAKRNISGYPLTLSAAALGIVSAASDASTLSAGQPIDIPLQHANN